MIAVERFVVEVLLAQLAQAWQHSVVAVVNTAPGRSEYGLLPLLLLGVVVEVELVSR